MMSSWVENPSRTPYVTPCGSVGGNKKSFPHSITSCQRFFHPSTNWAHCVTSVIKREMVQPFLAPSADNVITGVEFLVNLPMWPIVGQQDETKAKALLVWWGKGQTNKKCHFVISFVYNELLLLKTRNFFKKTCNYILDMCKRTKRLHGKLWLTWFSFKVSCLGNQFFQYWRLTIHPMTSDM